MKKFFSMLLLLCGFVALSATLTVNAAEPVATFDASTVVTSTTYAKYENDDWILTFGGYNSSVGSNSTQKAKCVLGADYAYVGEPLSFDATTTNTCAIISKKAIANVKEVQYTCKAAGNGGYQSTDIYLVSSDSVSSGFTQIGEQKVWATTLTFEVNEEGAKYYALVFHLTTTSNFRIDEVVATFMPNEVAGVNYYDVNYDTQGGSSIEAERVAENNPAPKPVDPKKDGYIFAGWYKEATCENVFDFETDVITGDTTIYAKWDVDPYTHAVIDNTNFLNSDGGTSTSYAGFNGSHNLSGIVFVTDQVANDGNDILFRSNASGTGVMYNTASISGNIKYIKLDITDGEYSVSTSTSLLNGLNESSVVLTKENPELILINPNDTYFYIKITSSGLGHLKSIDIAYEFVQKSTYSVSFDAAGGAFAAGKGEEITANIGETTSVTLPTTADLTTLYKYTTLQGWNDGTTTYKQGTTVEVSGDTSFSAVYAAPKNLTIAQAIEIADIVGSEKTTIKFSTTATIKSTTDTTIELTDDSTTETFIAYDGSSSNNKLASLNVGDVVTVIGKITTHTSGDTSSKQYTEVNKPVIKKYAYDTSFEAEQTKASLKLDGDSISIRFGNMISDASYNSNATYGVVVSKNASDLENLTADAIAALKTEGQAADCNPVKVNAQGVEDANGENYQFALVLTDVPQAEFDAVIYATMYVIDANNNVYLAQVKEASVKSVAAAYLEGDTSNFSVNTIEILNILANA